MAVELRDVHDDAPAGYTPHDDYPRDDEMALHGDDIRLSGTGLDSHTGWCYRVRRAVCSKYGVAALAVAVAAAVVLAVAASSGAARPRGDDDPSTDDGNPTDGGHSGSNAYDTAPCDELHLRSGHRLPTWVTPRHYSIAWTPKFTAPYTFTGIVDIEVEVNINTRCVVLHSHGLEIAHVSVGNTTDAAGNPTDGLYVVDSNYVYKEPNNDFLGLGLGMNNQLLASTISHIVISFTGRLATDMTGLYLSQYTPPGGGAPEIMISTQFEATYARRAFPCFDEPALKATFDVSVLEVPQGHVVLSNGFELSSHRSTTRTFRTTPRMSTYLVAVVAGKLEHREHRTGGGLLVRVWARAGFGDELGYALELASRILPHYAQVFGQPFPIAKCDLVAIPDFAAGAMENWGLVTFRETAMLFDTGVSSLFDKTRVAVVVAHELAHQWFGDLVTMDWWDGLWLNEGFASFMEYQGVAFAAPELNIGAHFIGDSNIPAMHADAFSVSHPLTPAGAVQTAGEIEAQFDSISYSKGASVINMARAYMNAKSEGSFDRGIRHYIETYQFENANTADLFESLGQSLPGDEADKFRSRLHNYTVMPGVPLVTVHKTSSNILQVSQSRFFRSTYSQHAAHGRFKDPVYWIPLTLKAETPTQAFYETAKTALVEGFEARELSYPISYNPSADGWLKANDDGQGYYRVNYDTDMWDSLIRGVAASANGAGSLHLTDNDKVGLIDDAFALAESGILQSTVPLRLVAALENETDYSPWRAAIGHLRSFRDRIHPDHRGDVTTGCFGAFDRFAQVGLHRIMQTLGFNERPQDSVNDLSLRASAFGAAALFGDPVAVAQADVLFTAWQGERASLPANLQSAVFSSHVRNGGEEAYNVVKALYEEEAEPQLRRRLLEALAAPHNSTLLRRTLDYSLSSHVREQDTVYLVLRVARNPRGRQEAWNFVTSNWDTFETRYGSGGFAFSALVFGITAEFDSTDHLLAAEAFWAAHPPNGVEIELREAYETVSARAAFVGGPHGTQSACAWLLQNYRG